MNGSRRLVMVTFFLLFSLWGGLLFWPFVLNNIIRPTAQIIWVLLRLFVLSIDQNYYWIAITLLAAFFLYHRFLPSPQATLPAEVFWNSNETMRIIGYWQSLFTVTGRNVQADKALKEGLARQLVALYAPKQCDLVYYQLYEALQKGEFPLPDHIYTYIFLQKPQEEGLLQFIKNTPRQWLHHWTGQAAAEHYHMIDEVLCFIETSLEIKNDNGTFNPHQH